MTTIDDIFRRQQQAYGIKNGMPAPSQEPAPASAQEQESESWIDNPWLKKWYSEEQINSVRNFNPKNGLAAAHYVKTFQKPELDEKALRRSRTFSSIGDGLKLLGQMFGAAKGARIDRNDPEKSLTAKNLRREDGLRKLYMQRADEWDKGYYNTLMQDEQDSNRYSMSLRMQMLDALKRKDEQDMKDERYRDEKEFRDRKFAEDVRQNMEMYVRGNIDRLSVESWEQIGRDAGIRTQRRKITDGNAGTGANAGTGSVELPKNILNDIRNIAESNSDHEEYAIDSIVSYLKSGGYSAGEIKTILKSIYTSK